MTRMKLKPIVCALSIGSAALSNAGCTVDGIVDSLVLEADPAAQFGAPAESAGTEHAAHAEARHFAIYNLYRSMVDSSGGSGIGSAASGYGAAEEAPDKFILWGSRLLGIEHLFCPAKPPAK